MIACGYHWISQALVAVNLLLLIVGGLQLSRKKTVNTIYKKVQHKNKTKKEKILNF